MTFAHIHSRTTGTSQVCGVAVSAAVVMSQGTTDWYIGGHSSARKFARNEWSHRDSEVRSVV